MAKKIFLDVRAEPAYFTLIGISCHLKDYRLSHHLNKIPEFNFARDQDISILQPGKPEPASFSFFYYRDDDQGNAYSLISNRNENSALIPEMKQLDFILVVEGEFRKNRRDQLLKSIRSIQNVLTAYELNPKEIRNFENLLTDIEMHIMNIFKVTRNKITLI